MSRAVLAALGVAVTYEANFGNTPAANGWVARAGRLLSGDDDPLAPWVWTTRAYVTSDIATSMALNQRALGAARATGDLDLELCALSSLGETRHVRRRRGRSATHRRSDGGHGSRVCS